MPSSWRKLENSNGFIFYMSENDKMQWDHPKYADIKLKLDDCNYIKFASYRVAHKFRVLQNALQMNNVPLSIIRGVFERHKLGTIENNLFLEASDLEAVLSDIFFATNKQKHTDIDVDLAIELVLNFIYNIFDPDRKTNVEVLPSKLTLALLCNCTINELHNFIFTLCCDHNNCVTRLRLQTILSKITAITNYLNETVSFGQHLVNSSIEQCFNNTPGLVGIDESAFYVWLENAPSIFTWLTILHRIKSSETVVHKSKCCVCKMNPIIGMKYKCIKCSKYVQCQRCFLTSRISHSHKLTHTMKEHCKENSSQFKYCFSAKFFKLLTTKYRVCDTLRDDLTIMDNRPLDGIYNNLLLKANIDEESGSSGVKALSSPLSQLQIIIKQLEAQNRELQDVLQSSRKNDEDIKKIIEEHRRHIANQVQKLKLLKEHLSNSSFEKLDNVSPLPIVRHNNLQMRHVQSTPMVRNDKGLAKTLQGLDLFSPISQNVTKASEYASEREPTNAGRDVTDYSVEYTMKDISTWLSAQPNHGQLNSIENKKSTPEQTDLDDALAKLQQILANNFSLDEALGSMDNCQLKSAVNEVEDVLSTIIDSAESHQRTPSSCFSSSLHEDQFGSFGKYTRTDNQH